jgi:inosine-uridine nucleoside N-ribohydrolase
MGTAFLSGRRGAPFLVAIVAAMAAFLCLAGRAAAASPVPLIIDTDIFTNADDVSAISSAFALQQEGAANVVAITVNHPTYRPAVAADSWKCVAAIDNFYGHPEVPIGAQMPDEGPADLSPYVAQCAQLAPPSAPAPADAVEVLRQALASQPDDSVVMVELGYEGNLEALLRSPGGAQLVAAKVSRLVVTGGTYPSSGTQPESNFDGDPGAAQYVAANWPTTVPIVWSGDDIGNAVRTGYSVPCFHPVNSPLLVSLDAFVGPHYNTCSNGPNIPSYDPSTMYHALEPGDPTMTENGPGVNAVIDQYGNNTFTTGAGTQHYLSLNPADPNAAATTLAGEIESLLRALPPTGTISGTVDDAATGQPIPGVTVQAQDALGNSIGTTTTGADGTYAFSGVYGGSYTLTFVPNSSSYKQATDAGVSLAGGQDLSGVDVALTALAPANTAPPTITGSAIVGHTLTESHGAWTNNPTGYAYQWEDCSNGTCSAIAGATAQSYGVSTSDVGSAIRVQEFASHGNVTGDPAPSAPTALVPAPPSPQSTTPTSTTPTTTTPPTTTPTPLVTVSAAQLRALLRKALAARGHGARIRTLVRNDGYRFSFAAPVPGVLKIAWYRTTAHGRKLLVARLNVVFHRSRTARIRLVLTKRGRALLAGSHAVRLTARGSFTPAGGAAVRATRSVRLRS